MGTTLQELLGARIRICIEKSGYRTVEEFAFAFGIGKSTLSDILTGKKSPTVTTLARWANALQIPLADFFEDERINIWVREAPPDYFHNRRKPAGDPAVRPAPKVSKGSKGAKKSTRAPIGPSRPSKTAKAAKRVKTAKSKTSRRGPSSPPNTFIHVSPEASAHVRGRAKPGKGPRPTKAKTARVKRKRAQVTRLPSGKN